MKKYRITCQVESAEGSQSWLVDADDAASALAKHNQGLSKFEHEEVEVSQLGAPDIEEVTDIATDQSADAEGTR